MTSLCLKREFYKFVTQKSFCRLVGTRRGASETAMPAGRATTRPYKEAMGDVGRSVACVWLERDLQAFVADVDGVLAWEDAHGV